ncbi:putative dehydrogenase [Nakamurella sp. UYEF19]|uniref:Gfo/Idh/MocA family protein n=1 Tax=Nakamurella sp. UYEF19 TaxID=1756392 RepID=UPI0033972D59
MPSYAPPATYVAEREHPLRWGVVGTGGIAHTVMSDLLLLPDAELVAVCSRSAERGAAYAAGLTIPDEGSRPAITVYSVLADMLPEIDVLYVATPHAVHHEAAIPALESGTAVLVEKAMTVHYPDAEAMVAASTKHRTFLMEGVWSRFNPLHVRLRALIGSGALGEIRQVVDDFSFRFPYDPRHRLFDPAQGGGALLDLGPYPVSMIQSLLGDPDSVTTFGGLAPNGVDDTATLLFRYPDAVSGIGTCTMRAQGSNTATVIGTLGRVEIAANALAPRLMTLHLADAEPEVLTAEIEGAGYLPQLREVQARVRAGEIESPVMPHRDSLSMMRILTGALSDLGVVHP